MSRNGSGTYTLPAGNPVVTGTTIESNWANTTLSDIATTLTDSLSRSGQGGMTAALRIADGTQGAPGLGFANETGSGLYRAGTGEVWAVVQGAQTMNLDANGVTVPSDKATSIEGTFVFNETGADKDARFEGDTDANLLFVDASADAVGIGTNSPVAKLTVNGNQSFSNTTYQIGYALNTETGTVAGANSPFYGLNMATFTGFSGNGIGLHGYYGLLFSTAGTERMRLDSSGNLGLGVTPSAWLGGGYIDFPGNGYVGNATGYSSNTLSTGLNAYYATGAWRYKASSLAATRFDHTNGTFAWFTAPSGTAGNAISFTQAMTLDASGNLLVGDTNGGLQNSYSTNFTQASGYWTVNHANGSPDTRRYFYFGYNGTEIGSITQNGTTGVLFNQTSDRRLKDNIVPAPSASDVIDAIQIVSHDWKSAPDEHVTYGVIAQDLALVAPQAVAVGDDGDAVEKPWGVDYSKLVPMLIKEIQSLRARVAALEAQ